MDRTSEFIKGKALFGSYPTQEVVRILEDNGVRYFFDLTCKYEKKIYGYTTKYHYEKYPITDHKIPVHWNSFSAFILKIVNVITSLKEEEKIYVHCKGGHGRSGIVVACILCHMNKILPSEAITLTTKYHNNRITMREKWRKIGSPQTRAQKHFVTRFFKPLYIHKDLKNNFRFPTQEVYNVLSESLIEGETESEINSEKAVYNILLEKFINNDELTKKLLTTGLRPVYFCSKHEYWGLNNGNGKNMLGKLLSELKNYLYII